MFNQLSDKILGSFKKLRGQHKISEANVEEAIKEIRMSLLEADVNFKVVKSFIDRVKIAALGAEVIEGVNPGQQFVKIVHEELIRVLGTDAVDIQLREKPAVLFLVGLQGAGKTTSCAKLALYIKKKFNKKVGLVPADIYRPAAIDQLQTLGKQNNFPVYPSLISQKPEEIVENAKAWAKSEDLDVVIVDTAGRLQVDDELMSELERIKGIWAPHEVLLVADAMLGQQSVNVAEGFHKRLGLTGLILTKVDGDARGGAALSIREVTGIPIKFLGVGEKVVALEVFHPDRLASRILDMGDVLSLVEKAQEVIDVKDAEESARKMMRNEFTVQDFLQQIQQLKKMGGFESILKFIPGMGQISKQLKDLTPPDQEIKKIVNIRNNI
jgi:signal recognition particle subunit SRP54